MSLSYLRQIDREIAGLTKEIDKVVISAFTAGWNTAVIRSPFRTGRLRNGWKLNAGYISGLIPAVGDVGGSYSKTPPKPRINFSIKKHKSMALYNNIPYAEYVEEGAGKGARVPAKMMFNAKLVIERKLELGFRAIR